MKRLCTILLVLVTVCSVNDVFAGKSKKNKRYPNFTAADSLHGALNQYRMYDVLFYDIDVDINPEQKYLQGKVAMDCIWKGGEVNKNGKFMMQIDLSSLLRIDSLYINNSKAEIYSREYNAVFVEIPSSEKLDVDTKYTLTCWYQGNPAEAVRPPWEGGMVWKTTPSGKPWCGVTCETLGASCWIPCKDHLSDEPDFGMRMKVSVPKGLSVVSNGTLQSHETINDKDVWTWQTDYTINSYNITFYIGDFIHFGEEYQGVDTTFPLDYYVLPEDEEKARKSFEQVKSVMAAYEDFYGPYPWPKDGFCLVESPYEGMEHQTAIAYGNGFKDMFGMDYIIVHESAHEWWGNAVSVDDYAEIFIHEGFAMYSEFLYVERMYGKDAMKKYATIWKHSMKNIRPVVGPRDVNFWDYHDTDPYVKGAWTLHGLRYLMDNDSLFFDILKSYNMSRRNQIVTVKDFTDYVNEKTGKDYSWYFKQYLYSEKIPVLQWTWLPVEMVRKSHVDYILDVSDSLSEYKSASYMYLKWTNVDSSFVMPISIDMIVSSENHRYAELSRLDDGATLTRIPVTTDGVIVKQITSPDNTANMYFNTSDVYFEVENMNMIKNNKKDKHGTKNNNSKRNSR